MLANPSQHPSFCFGPKNSMVWEHDVTEKINALRERSNLNLVRMKLESPLAPKPLFDERQQPPQLGRVVRENECIVRISQIVLHSKLILDKVVECIQIHIRE